MRAALRRWVELHPLLWAALLAVAAVAAADGYVAAGLGIGLLALGGILPVRRSDITVAAVVLAALAAGLHLYRLAPQRAAQRSVEEQGSILATVTARLLSEPQATGGGWSALAQIESGGPGGKVSLRGNGAPPGKGARIEVKGRFLPFREKRNPGEFDFANWLYRQGAWGTFQATGLAKLLKEPPAIDQAAAKARAWFRNAVTAGLDPAAQEAAVIRAMVLGEMPEDEDMLIEAYRQSGTLHAFSVSGMHVAMVGLIVWWVLRWCWVPRRAAIFVIVAAMIGYVWITGFKPPSIRALIMAGMVLSAFVLRQRPDLLNALGFAMLAGLLVDGHQLFQVGSQLSFGVVGAIGIFAATMRRPFAFLETRELYLPRQLYGLWRNGWLWFRQQTASALGASSAASFGSLPLTLWHFGFVSWVSILASPLMGLPVLLLMILALAATALAPFPAAQQQVNRWNGHVAGWCTNVATGFAAVPGGNMTFSRGQLGDNFLIAYDAGHGSGAACLYSDGSSVLFDTAHAAGFRRTVLPSLRYLALSPQNIVLSHPDGDHIGGTMEALDMLPVRQILLPVEKARSKFFRDIKAVSQQRGISTHRGLLGEKFPISPEAWLEVLHEPDARNQNAVADERVMVTRLHWHGWRVLFTSDAGLGAERKMLEAGGDLQADVIVAGRHVQDVSLGDDFLAAVQPKAIIASHADFPKEERIPENWAAACEKRGTKVFHQGRTGAVTLAVEKDGSLVIRGYLDGSELRLRR
ncbi:ComEC/Rec2 family competence protein [Luteolibacter soli]|uniref:ComEC/Rec2 family competence protein n=1 Tax=Luteolibacter soli TaxID=3135280 RepID=A0ABU9B172_9BACT